MSIVPSETPAPPPGFFSLTALPVGDRRARADGQGGELMLLFLEMAPAWGAAVARYRPITASGVELAAIDAHCAAEAAADLERRLNDGVAGAARRAIPFLLVV